MARYHTRSRQQIIDFMDRNPDQYYTADGLVAALLAAYGEAAPGKSTVYRLVGQMAQEQLLHRSEEEGTRRALYRRAGEHCHEHLHLKCIDCGKLTHMNEEESALLLNTILKNNGFMVDEYRSILLGRCGCCKEGAKK